MRRHFRPLPFAFAASAVAALLAASCLDDSTGPASVPGVLALQPAFASGAAGLVDIDRARILIVRNPGNVEIVDSIHPIAPGASEIDLQFDDIPITSPEDAFILTLSLISPLGDTVFRFGPGPVEVFPPDAVPEPTPVALDYVGPGSEAADAEFVTPPGSLFFGEAGQVMAQGVDEGGEPLPEAPVRYNALDPTLLAVVNDSTGEIQAQTQRGPARIEAELLTGQTDTLTIMVQPVPDAILVVGGDGQLGLPGQPLSIPVTVEVTGADQLGVQDVEVQFSTQDGGSFNPAMVTTGADGRAMAVWTLGALEGTQTGQATVPSANLQTSFTAEALPLEPARVTWTNPDGGSWTDPGNWDLRVPLAIDDAVIELAGDYMVVLSTPTTVASLVVGGGATGVQALQIDGAVLTSDGDITLLANGTLSLVDGTITGMGTITSSGPIAVTGASVSVITNPMDQTGPTDVLSGSLSLQGGGAIVGSSTISTGSDLDFTQGTFTLGDYTQSGGGVVSLSAGTLNVTGTATVENFVMVGGTLGGLGELDVTTGFVWTGGSMTDGGITVIEPSASSSIVSSAGAVVLTNGREFDNNGTLIWSGDVSSGNAAVLRNFGTVIVQTDAAFLYGEGGDAPMFDNEAVLEVLAGMFDVEGVFVHGTGAVLQGVGTLALDGATIQAFDGSIQPGAQSIVGLLTIGLGTNNLSFGLNALLELDINGPIAGVDHDQLAFTGSGTVTVNGTLQANLGVAPAWQDEFTILTYPAFVGGFSSDNLDPTMRILFSSTEGVLEQFAPPTATAIWEGDVDSDWFNGPNWNTGVEPSVSDNVFIPAGTPNDPTVAPEQIVSVNDLTVDEGASLSIQDAATVSTTGNVDAGFTSITGATLEMTGAGVTVRGAVPTLLVRGLVRVLDSVVANSISVEDGGTFDLADGEARVAASFQTVGTGTVMMMDPASTLIADAAFFGGGSTDGLLTDGMIQLTGVFFQGGGSLDAFAPSGAHVVAFVGDGINTQTVTITDRTSAFQELEVANSAVVLFQSDVIVNGSVAIHENGTLIAGDGGQLVMIEGDLATMDQGALATLADGATIDLAGSATFAGGSTTGLLDVGTLMIGGNLTQGSVGSTSSFAPGRFFETQFISPNVQQVSFESAGVNDSHFGILTIGQTVGVSFQTQAVAIGQLTTNLGGFDLLITGNGNTLQVAGVNADSIIFDNVPLVVADGDNWTLFDGITFQNMPPDQAQLSVLRSGDVLEMGIVAGTVFLTQPDVGNGGTYVLADDTAPLDQNTLTVSVFNATPPTADPGETVPLNGAVINWNP